MKQMPHFPRINITKTGKRFEGLAGVKLTSILKGDLILNLSAIHGYDTQYLNRLDPKTQHDLREAFLNALSAWPPDILMELHMTSFPDLVSRSLGRYLVTLFLRTSGNSEERIKEDLISRYIALMPLLAAHFHEMEFSPITDPDELNQKNIPFARAHAMTIGHREEPICLSTPLKRFSIGFGSMIEKTEPSDVIYHKFPWVPSKDDGSKLIRTLMALMDPIQIIVRFKPAPADPKVIERLDKTIQTCERFMSSTKGYQITLKKQAEFIRDISIKQLERFTGPCFKLGVFILAPHPIDTSIGSVLSRAITGKGDEDMFQGGVCFSTVTSKDALNLKFFAENEPVTLNEAACALRLPCPPVEELPGMPVRRARTSIAQIPFAENPLSSSIELFVNEHQGMSQAVKIGVNDRMRHTFIIGQTGTGKSTLMENMILEDIRNGKNLAVIDPHGEMVDSLLGKIPDQRAEDVILFDMLDKQPLGFNLIEWKTVEERDLIVDDLYTTLEHLYDMKIAGGPIFETNFRGMLRLLMGEKPRKDFVPTLLDFATCYLNSDFRKWLLESVVDPQICDFIKELERTGGEASLQNLSPYITSKLSRFSNDTTLKRIVGQQKTSFDFDEIMNQGKIFLVKLGKGRFGSTVSALIANQLVARFKMAAMKRGEMRPEDRKEFYIYLDEAHHLPSENFIELVSEARKYRLGLVLATQYTSQISGDFPSKNSLLSAIVGNVGTFLVFRLGHEDAGVIGETLQPYFSARDIVGLPNWQGYARMQLGNEATPPFSFRTIKDETPYNEDLAQKIKDLSRNNFGTDCKVVDEQILCRRSIWKKN
jgi:hypothetical protein